MLPTVTALALVAIAIVAYSIYQRQLCRRFYRNATTLIEQGKHGEALELLVKAESVWAIGEKDSILQDLELLAGITNEASRISSTQKKVTTASDLIAVITELKELFGNRSNFRIDGRSMKSEAAQKWVLLTERLAATRKDFRLALGEQNS